MGPPDTATRAAAQDSNPARAKIFAVPHPRASPRANADIARDFLDLTFQLESGRALPVMTRFEGPITVAVTGHPPASLGSDLNRLIYRLQKEAGIDIALAPANRHAPASVTIQTVSRAAIRRELPTAACFVAPNVSSLAEYRIKRRLGRTDWARMKARNRIAIFLPGDSSPQEVRDCLHEELAQALGPLNDLYRISESVFNDDNIHTVLTGFDMLILRLTYAPELHSGMRRRDVAAILPGLLNRINPAGAGRTPHPLPRTPRKWIAAIQTALGPGTSAGERRAAAARALAIATSLGWTDHRAAFSHYAMGRILRSTNPARAQHEFQLAMLGYGTGPETELHRAYVASQLAAYAVSQGRGDEAIRLIEPALAPAARFENAALLSTLMLLRAEALDLEGRTSEAATVRLDSLGWARYGFGPDRAVRAKAREIGSLSPLRSRGG